MRENLERVLQFMASKKIRMHQISSREVLEGNLKAVMRLILALAAHYKPQSVKHHDTSYDNITDKTEPHINGKDKIPAMDLIEYKASLDPTYLNPVSFYILEVKENLPETVQKQSPAVKRSPSLNDSHYGPLTKARLGTDPADVFRKLEQKTSSSKVTEMKASVETQTSARVATVSPSISGSGLPQPRGLNNEGFTRTGSGRKLPQIPDRNRSNTLPSSRKLEEEPELVKELEEKPVDDSCQEARKPSSKPKALEFWESMENIERNDFRYNTIHRMSMGRRLLPKPPDASGTSASASAHSRSMSVDRESSANEAEKMSLNSSFSGPTSLPNQKHSEDSSSASQSPRSFHKIPPDGASLQSHNSEGARDDMMMDCRREAEGSSNNNSPPTSVIQGLGDNNVWELAKPQQQQNPAYDWVSGH